MKRDDEGAAFATEYIENYVLLSSPKRPLDPWRFTDLDLDAALADLLAAADALAPVVPEDEAADVAARVAAVPSDDLPARVLPARLAPSGRRRAARLIIVPLPRRRRLGGVRPTVA